MNVIEKHKTTILIGLGIMIAGLFIYQTVWDQAADQLDDSENITLESMVSQGDDESTVYEEMDEGSDIKNQSLYVDIKGAIQMPGVYEMQSHQRVIDVIQKAGGLKEDSDSNTINFARQLEDEMMIYIPHEGEEVYVELEGAPEPSSEASININQADLNSLLSLNGIGPQKAQEIIAYRESNGPFSSIEDITNVSGIGEKTFEKIQDQITVN